MKIKFKYALGIFGILIFTLLLGIKTSSAYIDIPSSIGMDYSMKYSYNNCFERGRCENFVLTTTTGTLVMLLLVLIIKLPTFALFGFRTKRVLWSLVLTSFITSLISQFLFVKIRDFSDMLVPLGILMVFEFIILVIFNKPIIKTGKLFIVVLLVNVISILFLVLVVGLIKSLPRDDYSNSWVGIPCIPSPGIDCP